MKFKNQDFKKIKLSQNLKLTLNFYSKNGSDISDFYEIYVLEMHSRASIRSLFFEKWKILKMSELLF
ncbi:MAG: hypothetical protein DWQ06_08015 [Calditrichaeota bacterium]|nr:MAG: hypothetical protein DWQ06_08015 [Calditrichota bacterium]